MNRELIYSVQDSPEVDWDDLDEEIQTEITDLAATVFDYGITTATPYLPAISSITENRTEELYWAMNGARLRNITMPAVGRGETLLLRCSKLHRSRISCP